MAEKIEKPFIQQMTDSVKSNTPSMGELKDGASNTAQSVGNSINEMKDGVKNTLSEFSSKNVMDASSEFLNSNSLLAKFAFIVLILIVFMIVLKLMMTVLGYFMGPKSNPYIVKGALRGSDTATITQAPGEDTTIQILRSNDRHRGIEFTWSVWLFLTKPKKATGNVTEYDNIFVKGNTFDSGTGLALSNGPGLYVSAVDVDSSGNINQATANSTTLQYDLHFFMDHIGDESITQDYSQTANADNDKGRDQIIIDNVPIQKWFHVAIRMQNNTLDIYVNGTIVKRQVLDKMPKQNSHDIHVAGNNGFRGTLSNLRYYASALNVFQINNIVTGGPNLTPSKLSADSKAKSGNYSFLSNSWYSAAYQN
jgi:hypothetical protein